MGKVTDKLNNIIKKRSEPKDENQQEIHKTTIVLEQNKIIADILGLDVHQAKVLDHLLTTSSSSPSSKILTTLLCAPTVTENNYEDSKKQLTEYLLSHVRVDRKGFTDITISLTSGEAEDISGKSKTISSLTIHREQYEYYADMMDGTENIKNNNGQLGISYKYDHIQTRKYPINPQNESLFCSQIFVITNPKNTTYNGFFPINLCEEPNICQKVVNGKRDDYSGITINNAGLKFFNVNVLDKNTIETIISDDVRKATKKNGEIRSYKERQFFRKCVNVKDSCPHLFETGGLTSDNIHYLRCMAEREAIDAIANATSNSSSSSDNPEERQ